MPRRSRSHCSVCLSWSFRWCLCGRTSSDYFVVPPLSAVPAVPELLHASRAPSPRFHSRRPPEAACGPPRSLFLTLRTYISPSLCPPPPPPAPFLAQGQHLPLKECGQHPQVGLISRLLSSSECTPSQCLPRVDSRTLRSCTSKTDRELPFPPPPSSFASLSCRRNVCSSGPVDSFPG